MQSVLHNLKMFNLSKMTLQSVVWGGLGGAEAEEAAAGKLWRSKLFAELGASGGITNKILL